MALSVPCPVLSMQTGSLEHHSDRRIALSNTGPRRCGSPCLHQPPQSSLRVPGCRVDQQSMHRAIRVFQVAVEPLSQCRTAITAVKTQLRDQGMCDGVQQRVFGGNLRSSHSSFLAATEAVWAVFKRSVNGTWHHVSPKHLHRYVDEATFRLNDGNCEVDTIDRMESLTRGMGGKRLPYRDLTA